MARRLRTEFHGAFYHVPVFLQSMYFCADAVPALVAVLPSLDKPAYSNTIKQLAWKLETMESRDWRSWNWSTYAALGKLP